MVSGSPFEALVCNPISLYSQLTGAGEELIWTFQDRPFRLYLAKVWVYGISGSNQSTQVWVTVPPDTTKRTLAVAGIASAEDKLYAHDQTVFCQAFPAGTRIGALKTGAGQDWVLLVYEYI
jgi:hypothetical protein